MKLPFYMSNDILFQIHMKNLINTIYSRQVIQLKLYKINKINNNQQPFFIKKVMRKSLNWSFKEDQLIIDNFSLVQSKKWKMISNILKENGFEKKQTQCRQRYINHLAPSLDKNKVISAEELAFFYEKYDQLGPKWTLIQNFLPQKSQVQLKNIFYGNIRCFIKKIIKYFTKKTAVFVNKLKTVTLQNLYSGKRNFKDFQFLKQDLKCMNFKFEEDKCLELIKLREQEYRELFKAILDQEQTKQSKNYAYFKKFHLKNSKTLSQKNITSRSKNIDATRKLKSLKPQKEELSQSRKNHSQKSSQQKNQFLQSPASQFLTIKLNESQYLNYNQLVFSPNTNCQYSTFYLKETLFCYQNIFGIPVFGNYFQNQNFQFSNFQ